MGKMMRDCHNRYVRMIRERTWTFEVNIPLLKHAVVGVLHHDIYREPLITPILEKSSLIY